MTVQVLGCFESVVQSWRCQYEQGSFVSEKIATGEREVIFLQMTMNIKCVYSKHRCILVSF